MTTNDDLKFMQEAEAEARKGLAEGGIPIWFVAARWWAGGITNGCKKAVRSCTARWIA